MTDNSVRSVKWFGTAMSVTLAAAAVCFFGIGYHGHLRYCELCQLFKFTVGYAAEVISVPGGISDYIGRSLTQFYIYPAAGAIINAFLISCTQICCFFTLKRRTPFTFSLSLLPAFCVWLFLLGENALQGGSVALLLSVTSGVLTEKIRKPKIRLPLTWCLAPVMYMACGPMAAVFVFIAVRQDRKTWIWLASVIIAASLPLLARHLFECPEANLWVGVHYCRYRNILPVWLWAAAAYPVVCTFLRLLPPLKLGRPVLSGFIMLLCLTVVFTASLRAYNDRGREETFRYAFLALNGGWDSIIRAADTSAPKSYTAVKCLNLALIMKGQIGEKMFHYPQEGPECLIPDVSTDMVTQITSALVYLNLGLINTAVHFTFEAQEGLADFQKSGVCYRILAETNLAAGKRKVAFKYAEALAHTLFYRKWAESFMKDDAPEATSRDMGDQFFNYGRIKSILGLSYAASDGTDTPALDCLLACCLLEKDLDSFAAYLPLYGDRPLPQAWKEASLLHRSLSGEEITELTEFRNGPLERFSHTYWYYYFFRYRDPE